jgi:hypothetical protein
MKQNESDDLWMRVVKEIRNIANGSGTVEVKSASGDTIVIGTSDVTIRFYLKDDTAFVRFAEFQDGAMWHEANANEKPSLIGYLEDGQKKELLSNFGLKI